MDELRIYNGPGRTVLASYCSSSQSAVHNSVNQVPRRARISMRRWEIVLIRLQLRSHHFCAGGRHVADDNVIGMNGSTSRLGPKGSRIRRQSPRRKASLEVGDTDSPNQP
nr:hypothetical protein CFP56_60207 [Quercus suber]